ncbi:MAG: hypothetical protein K8W52_44125 [Deltaproteobacteria bacterium]|nr:hypothetical protein [Deltaproteobacteria bacterium]
MKRAMVAGVACLVLGCTKASDGPPDKAPTSAPVPKPGASLPVSPSTRGAPAKMNELTLVLPGVGEGPARVQTPQEAAAYGDPQCPRYVGARTTASKKIGKHGRTLDVEGGYLWQIKDGRIMVFDRQVDHPVRMLDAAKIPKGVIALGGNSWYVRHCPAEGCGEHGDGQVIDQVDMIRGGVKTIATGQPEIVSGQVFGDHLYWITFGPYGSTGELRRIPTAGGAVETLYAGKGMSVMLIDDQDVVVSDGTSVVAVARADGKARVLASGLSSVRALAADATDVYLAEAGDPYWKSDPSGYIKRVARKGGKVETLAGPLKWPAVIAVDDERIYYMLKEPGDIWSIDKARPGAPELLVPTPPRDASCLASQWLYADKFGLKWVRMVEGFHSGELWSLSRTFLPSPPDTAIAAFKRAMASAPGTAAPAADDDR